MSSEPNPVHLPKTKRSVRGKLVGVVLVTLTLVAASTLGLISWLQVRSTDEVLADTEHQIRASLEAKGRILASNHALALRNSVLDNAFSDVDSLVRGAVKDDSDVVYGLFLGSDNSPWSYVSPSQSEEANPDKPQDKGAWKELQLGDEPKPPTALETREVSLFGDQIQEFSMPVVDDGETLGTIYYGISTSRMRKTLETARAASRAELRDTLKKLAGLVLLNSLLGLLLAFRAARRITYPLANLTSAAARISSGEKDVRADVKSGDEIEMLATAFNKMVTELAESYKELEILNSSLEDKVKARTTELASRNKDMRLVLDNAQQGFITVYANGTMATERSAIVDRMLGTPEEGESLASFAGRSDANFGAMFELSFEMIAEDFLPRELCIAQLPKRATSGARSLAFHYVDLSQTEAFEGLLVVVEDITDRLERERQEKQQAEIMAIFRRIMQDRSGFESFYRETSRHVDAVLDGSLDADEAVFKRIVHTIKGNCGVMGLHVVAEICHEIENKMAETHALPSSSERQTLLDRWNIVRSNARALLGDQSRLEIERSEYLRLVGDLKRTGNTRLVKRLESWALEPVSRHFARIEDQAVQLAERLGRGPIKVVKVEDDVRLDENLWGPLWADLVHVVRNCIDHGLYPEGEVPAGQVQELGLRSAIEGGRLVIEVSDNGRGIQWDKVREKAISKGLPAHTRQDLVEALFADGLSTRDEVTATSGRGVGMSALRSTVLALGGTIAVVSEPGKGSRFILSLPPEGVYSEPRAAA